MGFFHDLRGPLIRQYFILIVFVHEKNSLEIWTTTKISVSRHWKTFWRICRDFDGGSLEIDWELKFSMQEKTLRNILSSDSETKISHPPADRILLFFFF